MRFSLEMETRAFNAHITRFIKRSSLAADKVIKKFAFDLLARIIKKWPVDTGRSRSAWHVSIEALASKTGGMPGEVTITGKPVKTPSPGAEEEGRAKGEFIDHTGPQHTEKFVEIVNGVHYSIFLEYGHSKTAPYGCVRISMRELSGQKPPAKEFGKSIKFEWNKIFYP